MEQDARGFTLIEVMITIVIIGILSTIILPMIGSAAGKSKVAEVQGICANFERLQQNYIMETGGVGTGSQVGFSNPSESKFFTYDAETTAGLITGTLVLTAGDCALGKTWTSTTSGTGGVTRAGTYIDDPKCAAYTSNFAGSF